MRKHRIVQYVAILIFIAAIAYLVLGLIGASLIGRMGLGSGWGSGWRGWLTVPVLVGTIFGFATLTVFGAVLFFLAKIDSNLVLTKERAAEAAEKKALAARSRASTPEPTAAVPVAIAGPAAEVAVITPEPVVQVAEAAVNADLPEISIAALPEEAELPEAIPSRVEAGFSAIAVEPPEGIPLRADIAVPHVEAALPAMVLPEVAVEMAEEIALPEPTTNAILPGSAEIARIAAEMAALKPAAWPAAEAPQPVAPDDLLQIDGIGPVFNERLLKAGLTTFSAIAEASDEFLAQVTDTRQERVQYEKWRDQARYFGHLD